MRPRRRRMSCSCSTWSDWRSDPPAAASRASGASSSGIPPLPSVYVLRGSMSSSSAALLPSSRRALRAAAPGTAAPRPEGRVLRLGPPPRAFHGSRRAGGGRRARAACATTLDSRGSDARSGGARFRQPRRRPPTFTRTLATPRPSASRPGLVALPRAPRIPTRIHRVTRRLEGPAFAPLRTISASSRHASTVRSMTIIDA